MNLTELKKKVFPLYMGANCKYHKHGVTPDELFGVLVGLNAVDEVLYLCDTENGIIDEVLPDNCTLILKPLSAISDEDAVEVAKILCGSQYIDIEMQDFGVHPTITVGHEILRIRYTAYEVAKFEGDKALSFTVHISSWGTMNTYITKEGRNMELGNCTRSLPVYDYLRSKHYALPYAGNDLFTAGIAIPA